MSEYFVEASSNGADALEKVKPKSYEVVLGDIRMPGMSAIELLDVIHSQNPDLPVVLITGFSDFNADVDALKNEFYGNRQC